MSKLTGFGSLGASKLMGLVGYGVLINTTMMCLKRLSRRYIREKKYDNHSLINIEKYGKENLAFTLQQYTIDKIREHIYPLKTCDNLCIVGGVAYNGYMNEEFLNQYENVYVPPAVGDEGCKQ